MSVNWVTIGKFSELTGYTEQAVRDKMHKGVWTEGMIWLKAPDGRILLSIEGYHEWVEKEAGYVPPRKVQSKSPSPFKAKGAARGSKGSPPPLILSRL